MQCEMIQISVPLTNPPALLPANSPWTASLQRGADIGQAGREAEPTIFVRLHSKPTLQCRLAGREGPLTDEPQAGSGRARLPSATSKALMCSPDPLVGLASTTPRAVHGQLASP